MPTRIFFANKEVITVSDTVEEVAQKLGAGGLAKLDRPWGDTSIYVNPSEIAYIEDQEERAPEIEALEASSTPGAGGSITPEGPTGAGSPGLPPLPGAQP